MRHQVLNRISRLFTSHTATQADKTQNEPEYKLPQHNTVKQKKPCDTSTIGNMNASKTHKKSRWSTLGIGKKTKRKSIPVGEWFPTHLEKDENRDSVVVSSSPVHVGRYYDEKVEIIVPSASINSFLTSTSTHSGYQRHQHDAPLCFSSPYLSPQHRLDEQFQTPRTSIDEQEEPEQQKQENKSGVGLATMVNHMLSDAFVVADQDIFDKDDFYD